MADDVTVHNSAPGDGTAFDVATDDDGSGNHIQLIKLVRSGDGSRTAISADGDGLDVDVTRLPKGATAFTDPAPDSSADLVLAANANRKSALIQNVGTVDVWLGPIGVTTATGILLEVGAAFIDDVSTSAWYGVTEAGTADLRVCEVS